MSQPISIDRAMPPPKSEHVHTMRPSAFDADAVSWTDTPEGEDATAVNVRPEITLPLVAMLELGTLMR